MKNKSLPQSVKCAVKGVLGGFKTERNFKTYIFIALLFLALNIFTRSGLYGYLIWLSLSCGAFAAEFLNTAVERLCDKFCSEEDGDVGFIKDVSAASVLITGVAFFGAEGAVIASNVLKILTL